MTEKIVNGYYQTNIKTSRNEDSVYAMRYANQQMLIDKLQQENQKCKEAIDKLKTNIENDIDGFRTINEFGESNKILELLDIYLDILKEVE